MIEYAITTEDNPIDPLVNPRGWFVFDCLLKNYNTPALLSRFALTSDAFSEAENNKIISDAIDEIIKNVPDPNGKRYVKVSHEVKEDVYGT